jgi:endogenous inhibitor of DNA gyrase (YacG/DUF329 family)
MAAVGEAQFHNTDAPGHCGREVATGSREFRDYEPFCSRRCRFAGLDCWFEGEYGIPGRPLREDDEAAGGLQQH